MSSSKRMAGIAIAALVIMIGLLVWIFRLNVKKSEMNKDLNLLNLDLEARVRQRTESLERKTESLEKYAFDMSHRVSGPVASILGLAALLESDRERSDENIRYIEGLRLKAESLDKVLHEINRELE